MQPSSREMQGMAASLNGMSASAAAQIALHDLHNVHGQQNFDHSAAGVGGCHDDFLDQMLSGLPGSWPELEDTSAVAQKLFNIGLSGKSPKEAADGLQYGAPYDESSLLASRLRQRQINGGGSSPTGKQMMLQLNHQQMLLQGVGRSPTGAGGESGLLPVPLSLGGTGGVRDEVDASYKSTNSTGSDSLYNGLMGSIQRSAQPQHFHHPQGASMASQSFGGTPPSAGAGQAQPATAAASASASAGGGTAPPRQRVRARRGQATDPHSIAERLRRERIAERMKALQELVPNANKTDKASMLDEIIDYVKFLQLQVKVLSMSRLGGAAAVAPLVADMSSEGGMGRPGANGGAGGANDSSITVTEHQVAKLMEEDMGSAMQYLQGKGLCLMPISLASAISSATCHPRPPQPTSAAGIAAGLLNHGLLSGSHPPSQPSNPNAAAAAAADGPSSPSVSVLTVQSAAANGTPDADGSRLSGNKDNTRP